MKHFNLGIKTIINVNYNDPRAIIYKLVWYQGLYLKTQLLKYRNKWVEFIIL